MPSKRKLTGKRSCRTRLEEKEKQSGVVSKRTRTGNRTEKRPNFASDACVEDDSRENDLINRVCNIPPVVERIFHYLPARDLSACSRVCKLWNIVSESCRKDRRRITSVFWMDKDDRYAGVAPCISTFLQKTFVRPKTAILIATADHFSEPKRSTVHGTRLQFIGSTNASDSLLVDKLVDELPRNCELIGISADRVIGASVSPNLGSGFTCLFLPEMPGVNIRTFLAYGERWGCAEEFQKCAKLPTNVKAMLFFSYEDQASFIIRSFLRLNLREKGYMAPFGTGCARTLVASKRATRKDRKPHTLGVAFSGDNVEAASVCLDTYELNEDSLRTTLMQFKSFPQDKSFAFVSSSNGYYADKALDGYVRLFRELYPKIPLFGGVFPYKGVQVNRFLSSQDFSLTGHADEKDFNYCGDITILVISFK